ncbi:hypothetical protein D3C78_1460380 [compost metagenome]
MGNCEHMTDVMMRRRRYRKALQLLISDTGNGAKIIMRMNLTVQNKRDLFMKCRYILTFAAFGYGDSINSHIGIQILEILFHIMDKLFFC